MRARRRSKNKVLHEVLSICSKGQSITQIVYKSNTNFTTIRSVIELLKEKKLIETIDGSPVLYKTSVEGMRMMDRLKMFQDELEGIIGK
jgi:predicted transcriptional regulator